MIGCLRTRVRKHPNIALYFESENELQFYNLEDCSLSKELHHKARNRLKNPTNIDSNNE